MKKIMFLAAIAACAMFFVSCDGKEKEEKKYKAQIATFNDQWEGKFTYTFNADGKPTKIVRESEGATSTFDFAYSGTNLTITVTKPEEEPYTFAAITFGSNGYVSSFKDEWEETYNYVFDANGYITSCSRDGAERGTCTITNGDIMSFNEGADTRNKNHTYGTDENIAGIYNIYFERIGAPRWLVETGMFGKAVKHLCATSQWDNSETGSTYNYTADENGWITKETKMYGSDPEVYEYTWTKIEVK